MVKFILKITEYYRSYRNNKNPANIFLEKYRSESYQDEKDHGLSEKTKVERIKTLLNRIKNS